MPMAAHRSHRALLWIAVFKLVKATLLLIVAATALRLSCQRLMRTSSSCRW